jgi:hypothetical protein
MKTISATFLSLIITASYALASAGSTDGEGLSLLATFFIAFGILIVMFQFIPGIMLFGTMLKGLFSSTTKTTYKNIPAGADKPS